MTELEKAAVEAFKQLGNTSFLEIFKAGANWQYEQFEKNNRIPTYSEAIDYFKKKKNNTTYLESLYQDLKKLTE